MSIPISSLLNPSSEVEIEHQDQLPHSQERPPSISEVTSPGHRSKRSRESSSPSARPSKRARVVDTSTAVVDPDASAERGHNTDSAADQLSMVSILRAMSRAGGPSHAPPSTQTDVRPFSILNALFKHPEITLELALNLGVDEMVSLYSMSRKFHSIVNKRIGYLLYRYARQAAPESTEIFRHGCYKNLCLRDPAGRTLAFSLPQSVAGRIRKGQTEMQDDEVRYIPTFRWLKMILFREAVVCDILCSLAEEGHFLPASASVAIKKLWFLMDLSTNQARLRLIHNENFWTKNDLYLATMFFFKVDMRFTDPTHGTGELGLRKLCLAQRSMSTLAGVLRRDELQNQAQLMQMLVETEYHPPPTTPEGTSIFGVPASRAGRLSMEGWGDSDSDHKFMTLDYMIMAEAIRRRLRFPDHYIDMMLYGYIDPQTHADILIPVVTRRQSMMAEIEELLCDLDEDSEEEEWEGFADGNENGDGGQGADSD